MVTIQKTIRLTMDVLRQMRRYGRPEAAQIAEDVNSYLCILDLGLESIQSRFSKAEMELLMESLKGEDLDSKAQLYLDSRVLAREIERAIIRGRLDELLKVDSKRLLYKLNNLKPHECAAVLHRARLVEEV